MIYKVFNPENFFCNTYSFEIINEQIMNPIKLFNPNWTFKENFVELSLKNIFILKLFIS